MSLQSLAIKAIIAGVLFLQFLMMGVGASGALPGGLRFCLYTFVFLNCALVLTREIRIQDLVSRKGLIAAALLIFLIELVWVPRFQAIPQRQAESESRGGANGL